MRRTRHSRPASPVIAYHDLAHRGQPSDPFSQDDINAIHNAALDVLQEMGIKILCPESRNLLAQNGARLDDEMVYIGRDMIEAAIKSAPKSFDLVAQNPKFSQQMALGRLVFAGGGGCPNAYDRIEGRRAGRLIDYRRSLMLQHSFDVIGKIGPSPEPTDVAPHLRHYAMVGGQIELTDRSFSVYARGRAQVEQSFEMIQLAGALTDAEFRAAPRASTVINTNSPRMIDAPMGQGLIDFARFGQIAIITPFCLAGAMAPITVAGALTLQHAEVLAGLTISQLAKAGAPVIYGGFGSNVNMKSGSPAFGTPTHMQMTRGTGQLARHLGLPWRTALGTASNTADMQAALETTLSLHAALEAQATLILHAAGWLEGGLTFGFEKFINDIEMLQMIARDLIETPDATTDALAVEAIEQTPPSGHFFDAPHTMTRYKDAFYEPLVADLRNFETWQEAGAEDAQTRATRIWQNIIDTFTPPNGAQDRSARVEQYIADHTAKGGAEILS